MSKVLATWLGSTVFGGSRLMKKESIYRYFYFGTCMRYLQDCDSGIPVKGTGYILQNIDSFLSTLETLGLQVTKRASTALVDIRDEFNEKTDKDAELSVEEASRLKTIMNDIRKTLTAEITEYHAFVVTPKILDTEKLLNNVSSLLRPNVFSELPDIAQYDLNEAGKCIAFERPTATAFHLLRGTESVLHPRTSKADSFSFDVGKHGQRFKNSAKN